MDIRMQRRAVTLLYRLFLRNSTEAHQIPYTPSKTELPPPSPDLPGLVSPEAVGIPSARMTEFLHALERERDAKMHAVAAARAGNTFLLAAAPGYAVDMRHQTHSMCKTITGLCIGILVDEGKLTLDTPAYRAVGEGLPPLLSPRMRSVTVHHLLSMTAGVVFAEVGSVTEENWVRSFFESSVAFAPGSDFSYNSMNSYILSVIVERLSGMPLAEFARERILRPLGIADTLWESCPGGHTKGGWGMYLSCADMLKIGELIANGGTYGGVRILSREWMRTMVKTHAETPESFGGYDYGYHIWVARDRSAFLCNGMLGQNIWIHPKNQLVVVTTAGNCELFQDGAMFGLLHRYFTPPLGTTSLKPNRQDLAALRAAEAGFFAGRTWSHPHDPNTPLRDGGIPRELWDTLGEREYLTEKNNFGILPLFIMLMQNNLATGISKVSFAREGDAYFVTVREGAESYRLPVGFLEYLPSVISVRGERYRVACRAEFCDDTDGEPILKLEILFPELASSRRMRLYYDTEKPTLVLSEAPGRTLLDDILRLFDFIPRAKLLGGILRSQMEREMIAYRVRACYEPTLRLGRGSVPENSLYSGFDALPEANFSSVLRELEDRG